MIHVMFYCTVHPGGGVLRFLPPPQNFGPGTALFNIKSVYEVYLMKLETNLAIKS